MCKVNKCVQQIQITIVTGKLFLNIQNIKYFIGQRVNEIWLFNYQIVYQANSLLIPRYGPKTVKAICVKGLRAYRESKWLTARNWNSAFFLALITGVAKWLAHAWSPPLAPSSKPFRTHSDGFWQSTVLRNLEVAPDPVTVSKPPLPSWAGLTATGWPAWPSLPGLVGERSSGRRPSLSSSASASII